MYEIDKEAFSAFLTELRKEKGWTQKDLAEKVLVSDKAVSKWERALSLPDISLLMPLAETLGVTVTELLEGKRMENSQSMEPEDVELLVKKALSLSGEDGDTSGKKRRTLIFAGILAAAAVLWAAVLMVIRRPCVTEYTLLLYSALAALFGGYAWIFMKERLPDYYDENVINFYSDGIFRMNLPGVRFHNRTWPNVLKALRLWSAVTLLAAPVISLFTAWLMPDGHSGMGFQITVLLIYLGGLFLPVYLAAKESNSDNTPGRKRKKVVWIALAVAAALLLFLPGQELSFKTMEIGYVSSGDFQQWSASYALFSGTKVRNLHPETPDYILQVETRDGSLSVDIQDDTGTVFSQTDLQTGTYPIILEGKTTVTLKAQGHKGSFRIGPTK